MCVRDNIPTYILSRETRHRERYREKSRPKGWVGRHASEREKSPDAQFIERRERPEPPAYIRRYHTYVYNTTHSHSPSRIIRGEPASDGERGGQKRTGGSRCVFFLFLPLQKCVL